MEFTGICLITQNVLNLTEFYSKILGVEAEGDETHAELKTSGASLSIFSVNGMENMSPNSMEGAGYGSLTIGFKVKDVDLEYERLKKLSVDFIKLPTTHPWGSRSLWFKDPDGNIINFYCSIK